MSYESRRFCHQNVRDDIISEREFIHYRATPCLPVKKLNKYDFLNAGTRFIQRSLSFKAVIEPSFHFSKTFKRRNKEFLTQYEWRYLLTLNCKYNVLPRTRIKTNNQVYPWDFGRLLSLAHLWRFQLEIHQPWNNSW